MLSVSSYARYCASMVLTAVALQGCCLTVRLIGCRMAAVLAMCRPPWCFLPYGAGKGTENALGLAAAEQLTVPDVCAPDAGLLALHCAAVRLDDVWADLVQGCLVRLD